MSLYGLITPEQFYEDQPEVGFQKFLGGFQPGTALYDWLAKQYQRYYNQYLSKVAEEFDNNPTFSWMKYLTSQQPEKEFNLLPAASRGLAPSSLFSSRSRWFGWG